MQLTREYRQIKFSVDVIKEAVRSLFEGETDNEMRTYLSVVTNSGDSWLHDDESEFFLDYSINSTREYVFEKRSDDQGIVFRGLGYDYILSVEVTAPIRNSISKTFEVLEENLDNSRVSAGDLEYVNGPAIFIGHGHSTDWRDLRDHLQDQHNYKIIAYEIGSRSGHAVRDILKKMLDECTFALLVMTAEDETTTGGTRPRQNVIHECGLFQGRLGFDKAIVLMETGIEVFSNIDGIARIEFSKNNIREAYGDVLAALAREFDGNT